MVCRICGLTLLKRGHCRTVKRLSHVEIGRLADGLGFEKTSCEDEGHKTG